VKGDPLKQAPPDAGQLPPVNKSGASEIVKQILKSNPESVRYEKALIFIAGLLQSAGVNTKNTKTKGS